MVSARFGLVAVQLLLSGVAARPRCHPPAVSSTISSSDSSSSSSVSSLESSTIVPGTATSSASLELSSTTEAGISSTATSSDSIDGTIFSSVTSTSASESLPSSTVFSTTSTIEPSSTTSAPYCDPTPTYLPEYCWASVPDLCADLNKRPALPDRILTMSATACRRALSANGALPTAVAGCFAGIGGRGFNPTSAYSCVSAASIYCQSTTASCDPYATPTATPLNGGFESSGTAPWVGTETTTPGNIQVSVTSERSHSGGSSLKWNFLNMDGGISRWEQDVKVIPGATYQLSYWWYSANAQAYSGTYIQASFGGKNYYSHQNTDVVGLANQWVYSSLTFVAPTSFGKISFSASANKGPAANTIYLDDVELKLV